MNIYRQFTLLDLMVMVLYVVALVSLGTWISFRKRTGDAHLFLAQRSLGWPSIGLSMWGTNVGPSMLIASASIGYSTGIVAGNFSWYAFPFILLLALVFAPKYLGAGINTLPEFMGRRFSENSRTLLAWYSLITILVSWLGMTLYAGGLLASQIMNWPLWLSVTVLVVLSAFLAVAGGLKAVAGTNVFQMSILIVASAILLVTGFVELGRTGQSLSEVPKSYWRLLLPADDPNYPWYAILLGYPVLGVWFWCTDQSMVQSVLGARTLKAGQLGANFTAWLKILDVPLFILPGVLCFLLYPTLADPNEAYMTMATRLLPPGLLGLIVVVIMAALVSTISSALNSLSTIFTLDIYVKRFKPNASSREIIRLGRVTALCGAVLSIFLALGIAEIQGLDLFSLFQAILSYLAPPISTVFLVGVLWKRATPAAANTILSLGAVISLGIGVCQLLQFPNAAFWPHFLFLSFLICSGLCLLMILVSLMTRNEVRKRAIPTLSEVYRQYGTADRIVWVMWSALVLVMLCLYAILG